MKQKTVKLSLITSLLISSHASGMLLQRTLKTQKYMRTYRMKPLGSETIFNTTNPDPKHQLDLLDDLHDRNDKIIRDLHEQIKLLKQQNNIANNASHSYTLDRDKLKYLETQIHEGFNDSDLMS